MDHLPVNLEKTRTPRRELLDNTYYDKAGLDIRRVTCECGLDTIVVGREEAQRYIQLHNSWCTAERDRVAEERLSQSGVAEKLNNGTIGGTAAE